MHHLPAFLLWLAIVFNSPRPLLATKPSASSPLYVVPLPLRIGEERDGSLRYPYSTLQQAMDHIERAYNRDTEAVTRTTIQLYPTHHFVDTIRFGQAHSRTRLTTMSTSHATMYDDLAVPASTSRRLSRASISGGIPVTGWTHVNDNTYSATVSGPIFVNQLFVNDRRVVRSRVPMNPADYLYYAAPLPDPNQARYGFQYVPGQFDYKSLSDAMVVVYHSWTTSHHYIDHLIPTNNTIMFTNPSGSPIGTFVVQGQRRFHIENLCESLVPNSFCFVNETQTVYLMTDGSYDPSQAQIVASTKEFVVVIASADASNPVTDIIVDNVAIQHSAWNIGRFDQADNQAAAFLTSAPLYIANATSIVVSNIEVSHTGSYGVWVNEGTSEITLINSLITDTGAGGIRIGQMISPVPLPTTSVKILSNEVSYGGNVFPSGVGVISQRAIDIVIADNTIHHHRYSGISVGWQWGYAPSSTSNVLVQGNYIYNVGQHFLCDQGGIYTLGLQPGTVISGNVIKNVYSFAVYSWGIYLDEGTSDIVVSDNVVYNTGWGSMFQHYGANNTIINNVFARASMNGPPHPGDYNPDGDIHVETPENHTSWTFTRNIVYDTFQGDKHSAYDSDLMVVAPSGSNLYYNPYGTPLLFGPEQLPLDQWQKTGQENGSVIADPLFAGDVSQCDFFTVQPNSPAAQLGFRNLTKLTKWTPGCDETETNGLHQFYYW
jgi:parallel beta-helix repeat protein